MRAAAFRENTNDEHIWQNIVQNNEYNLPEDLSEYVALDIGAHIGAFTWACLMRGCQQVWAYEPDHDNANFFIYNMQDYLDERKVAISKSAVWSTGGGYVQITKPTEIAGRLNTGNRSIAVGGELDYYVPRFGFDHIIEGLYTMFPAHKVLVKLDCEGAEWAILFESDNLHLAERIVGEWHSWPLRKPVCGKTVYTIGDLMVRFNKVGFMVEATASDPASTLGVFHAKKIPK